ncbi:hypothetical protein OS493_031652 [Desmophyllum pertusum]|uniref:ILEI/PANDER domain-containing protein n=1 Tax=Desmophyllum pertusum TaxID=174260 RepID=A0A9W9Y8H6_9CNID|nr:hypothetical protein OS493_031652 [Desmophyllum pertusum]
MIPVCSPRVDLSMGIVESRVSTLKSVAAEYPKRVGFNQQQMKNEKYFSEWNNVPVVDIFVRSEGCEDPGKAPNTCGIAYIKVNGKDHSLRGRGINVVVVDATAGVVLETKTYDTHGDGNAANRLKDFLNSLQGDVIVVVAAQDEAARLLADSAIDALKRLGAIDPIKPEYRGSYAFVGYARVKKPSWIAQQWRGRGKGPSEVSLKVPLTPNPFVDIHVRSEGCNDPGKRPNTCGIASIKVDGIDRSLHGRGHNVVIVDARTGAVLEAKAFDTHGDGNAGNSLRSYLDSKNGQ